MENTQKSWLPPAESRADHARPYEWRENRGWRCGYDVEGHVTDLVDLATGDGYVRMADGRWCAGTWKHGHPKRTVVPCHSVYVIVRGARLPPIIDPVNLDSEPSMAAPEPPKAPVIEEPVLILPKVNSYVR